MKKIHVAFCLRDMKIGGVESVLTRTLDVLSQNKNLKITVCTYTPIRDIWKKWFESHPQIDVRVMYPHISTDLPRLFLWRILKHFVRDIYRYMCRKLFVQCMLRDIDVFVDYYDFDWVHELKNINKPKIAWWHSSSDKFVGSKYSRHLDNYDRLVVLTDAFAYELRERHPDYANKIIRIYNPIDIKNARSLAKIGTKRADDYFVCVARLVNGKDIETVINAFDEFWKKNNKPDVDLLIVGDGYARSRLEACAQSVSAGGHIVFIGSVDNPFGFMCGARANILSSIGEGFALVLIESAAIGTLNIASDCKYGPREILLDGRAGLLFDVGDVTALTNAMDVTYNNKINVKKIINTSTRNLKRFDIKEIANEITDLLTTIH